MAEQATQAQLEFPDGTCLKIGPAASDDVDKAAWTTAYINKLPDSAFLHIESGGEKDDEGKTKPRSLRHFPVRDAAGALDKPHVVDALSRIPQSDLPQSVKDSCSAKAKKLLAQINAKKRDVFELTGRVLKAADAAAAENPIHYVLSVVLEPNPPDDTQKDTYTEADVWEARRTFMKSQQVNLMHAMDIGKGVAILDNWITPVEFEYGGQKVVKGSWLVGAEIDEREQPELWGAIKSGAVTTWSIEGDGVRTPLADEEQQQAAA